MVRKVFQPHLSSAQDARAVRTREALRSALLDLLETTPLEQLSILDIATAAGIGYSTFFRHHTSKEALLQEIAAEQIRRLVNMVLPMLDMSEPRAASVAMCSYVNDHRKLWSGLLTGGAAGALRQEFLNVSSELAASRPQASTQSWRPTEIAIILLVSSTIELLAWWLRQKKPMPVKRIAEIHERMILTPGISQSKEKSASTRPRKQHKHNE
jgi:AcrR family transcriptional regulator